jgi:hypothetical protein
MDAELKRILAEPLRSKGTINPRLQREASVLLGQSLLQVRGLHEGKVEAFALALRDVTEQAPFSAEQKLSRGQAGALEALASEAGVPEVLREVLVACRPQLSSCGDVAVLYGLIRGALEFTARAAALAGLEERGVPLGDPRGGSKSAASLRHGGAR